MTNVLHINEESIDQFESLTLDIDWYRKQLKEKVAERKALVSSSGLKIPDGWAGRLYHVVYDRRPNKILWTTDDGVNYHMELYPSDETDESITVIVLKDDRLYSNESFYSLRQLLSWLKAFEPLSNILEDVSEADLYCTVILALEWE